METKTFYWYFKPIALLCKIMGIFPVQNIMSADPKDLKVKLISLAQLYSTIIFVCNIYMIGYFSGFVFNVSKSLFVLTVVYVTIVRSSVCFIFCASYSKKLPKLIRLLHTFDTKKTVLINDKNSVFSLKNFMLWTILPIIIGLMCFFFSFYESIKVIVEILPPDLKKQDVKICSFFFGALSLWQVVPLLLYIYFAIKIISNFKITNQILKEKICKWKFLDNKEINFDNDIHQTFENLRHMHCMLTKCVYELGKCYGKFMAIDQLCVIVMVVINLGIVMETMSREGNLLAITIFNLIIVLSVLLVSDRIKKSGTKVVDLLHGITFSKVNQKSRAEIKMFMIQMIVRPVEVSAGGYFIIDKRQIPSMLSSIATYLIVVVQFADKWNLSNNRTLSE